MWIIGDWGQEDPWMRTSGIQMVKGEDGLYTGVLTLPKGTRFDLKILKNPTVDRLIWSATRYTSVLNSDGVYDFGEFTDNLVLNGDLEEGAVKWTPATGIQPGGAHGGDYALIVGGTSYPDVATSDKFIIPPNQNLKCSLYAFPWSDRGVVLEVRDVDTQSALFKETFKPRLHAEWNSFAREFKTGSSTVNAQLVITSVEKNVGIAFDDITIVSP